MVLSRKTTATLNPSYPSFWCAKWTSIAVDSSKNWKLNKQSAKQIFLCAYINDITKILDQNVKLEDNHHNLANSLPMTKSTSLLPPQAKRIKLKISTWKPIHTSNEIVDGSYYWEITPVNFIHDVARYNFSNLKSTSSDSSYKFNKPEKLSPIRRILYLWTNKIKYFNKSLNRRRIHWEIRESQSYLTLQCLAIIAKIDRFTEKCFKQKTRYLTIYKELWDEQ